MSDLVGSLSLDLTGPEQTTALGRALAAVLSGGEVVLLLGDLGAGKTTLVKGLVGELSGESSATSPSFALCHLYETEPVIAHVDCWRLDAEDELADLALDELLEEGASVIIEWGELARHRFGGDALDIELSSVGPSHRSARVTAVGSARRLLSDFAASCRRQGLSPISSVEAVR